MSQSIRLAVSGARRGAALAQAANALNDRYIMAGAFDPSPRAAACWREHFPSAPLYASYDDLLAGDCDAVLVASPVSHHAEQAVAALRAGKHVLSEVPACVTHDQAMALIAAAGATDRVYMMAENVCYLREHLALLQIVRQGVFGELTFAEGGYLHDVRDLAFNPDGSLTWRGKFFHQSDPAGIAYPTHSLGPIAWWFDLNRGDKLATVYSLTSPAPAMANYTRQHFGDEHPGASPGYWGHGDTSHCLIHTQRGRVIHLRMDLSANRPAHNFTHELQGTQGTYKTNPDLDQTPVVWLDGHSRREGHKRYWQPISDYYGEFEHPLWRTHGDAASRTGHSGADYFVMQQFHATATGEIPSPIDVVDAVTWSSIVWLTRQSEAERGPVQATDYGAIA
jgi:predicted dehydrogenase